jgi:hypothetical protein
MTIFLNKKISLFMKHEDMCDVLVITFFDPEEVLSSNLVMLLMCFLWGDIAQNSNLKNMISTCTKDFS